MVSKWLCNRGCNSKELLPLCDKMISNIRCTYWGGEFYQRKSNGFFYENCDQRKYFKVLLPPCAKQFLNHMHMLRGRFSKWSKLLRYKMLWSRITSTLIVFPNDFSIGFKEEWTVPKDRPFYFMHGVIRMVRLGISSHDPQKPEGSTQGQSTR